MVSYRDTPWICDLPADLQVNVNIQNVDSHSACTVTLAFDGATNDDDNQLKFSQKLSPGETWTSPNYNTPGNTGGVKVA